MHASMQAQRREVMGVGRLEHILKKMHAQHQPQAAELAVQIQELKSFVQSKFSRSFAGFVVRLCVSTLVPTLRD